MQLHNFLHRAGKHLSLCAQYDQINFSALLTDKVSRDTKSKRQKAPYDIPRHILRVTVFTPVHFE